MVDVVIVGAGLAGLSAARELKRSGATVRVLESRRRIGGRVHSVQLEGGVTLDLGAQLVGDAHVQVRRLVDDAGLRRVAIHTSGDVLQAAAGGDVRRYARGALPLGWLDHLDALQASWRLGRDIKHLRAEKAKSLDRIKAATFLRSRTVFNTASATLGGYYEGEFCAPLDEVSAYEFLEQARAVGGLAGESASASWFLPDGASDLASSLMEGLAEDLFLNSPVTSVVPDRCSVSITVHGETIRARHAIIAIPPQLYGAAGVLPHLPQAWRAALTDWRTGAVVKTILVFDRPWWRARGLSGGVISPGEVFSAAVDTSPGADGPGVLVVFSTARGARTLGKTEDEGARIGQAMDWVRRSFGGDVPALVTGRSVDWSADPESLGGYASRRAPGGWADAPDLFKSLGRLHFAGTETAGHWRGFMEGAIESGLRAAEDVRASV